MKRPANTHTNGMDCLDLAQIIHRFDKSKGGCIAWLALMLHAIPGNLPGSAPTAEGSPIWPIDQAWTSSLQCHILQSSDLKRERYNHNKEILSLVFTQNTKQ